MAATPAAPLVTIASEHGAGGELVAPRVAEALGAPFLDRALRADPEQPQQRPGSVVGSLARASTMLGSAPLEPLDLDEGHARAELAEFLARAERTGGVVLGDPDRRHAALDRHVPREPERSPGAVVAVAEHARQELHPPDRSPCASSNARATSPPPTPASFATAR